MQRTLNTPTTSAAPSNPTKDARSVLVVTLTQVAAISGATGQRC